LHEGYNRKEKSLGQLCKKFLNIYGGEKSCTITLDACTQQLKVERRRLYDIVNILESLSAVGRVAKNLYEWKGLESISMFILRIQVFLPYEH
jgi:transcription factor E2F7/8